MRNALLFGLLALACGIARAQDDEPGRSLYSAYCSDCHYERVHEKTREASSVKTLVELRAVVERRAAYTTHRFTPEEITAVTRYLDREFYKLPR
jgi:hypothetical protein